MKKPDNWKTLGTTDLTNLIHNLNVWNSNQQITDAAHNAHYKDEIEPLVKLRDSLWKSWLEKEVAK